MTEQPLPTYPHQLPMPRQHAEMNWKDLLSLLISVLSFLFLTPLGLGLAWSSYQDAKKINQIQHPTGTVGLILGAIGVTGWVLFLLFFILMILISAVN